MKEDFYFSHDYHASEDEKIIKLLKEMGWEGYGLYWGIIERIYRNGGSLIADYEQLAFSMRTQSDRIASVVTNYDLFVFDGNRMTTHRVTHQLSMRKSMSEKARKSAQIRWNKRLTRHATAMPSQCDRNAIKERKGKERKENKIAEPSLFSFEEIYSKYPKRIGTKQALRHFNATVKTEQDWQDINKALENYLKTKEVKNGFIKYGSTWFNCWRDYVNYSDPTDDGIPEEWKTKRPANR